MKLTEDREVLFSGGNAEEGYIHTENGRVWYRIAGTDKIEGGKAPILCVHGGPGSSHYYLTPMEGFADERPVILYDQLGCGNSDRPLNEEGEERTDLYTLEYFADEIDIMREAFGLDDFYFLGQSWGSLLGSYYLLDRTQEGIRGVIFAGPALSVPLYVEDSKRLINDLPEENRDAVLKAIETGDFDTPEFAAADEVFYLRHVCRTGVLPDYVVEGRQKKGLLTYHTMWGPSEFICNGTLRNYDVVDRLGEIHVPVLYICGEYDECTPEASKIFADATPGAELVVVKDGAHMQHVEKPEEFRAALDAFMAKHE